MKNKLLKNFFSTQKSIRIPLAILVLVIGIYAVLHFFFLSDDPVARFFSGLFDGYQLLIERLANLYLKLDGNGIYISGHQVYLNDKVFEPIENGMLLKRWTVVLLLIFWATPARTLHKAVFSLILACALLILLPLGFAVNAYYNTFESELLAPFRIGMTFPLLAIVSLLLVWIRRNWKKFRKLLGRLPAVRDLIEAKPVQIVVILYFFLILKTYITGLYAFEGWVSLIFRLSVSALQALGYQAETVPFYLYGDNVLIFMNKSCLGFGMMAIFASIVFLTGKNNWVKWTYILTGILLLNMVNVLRFILLYIYLFKHGKYLFSIDIHDIYTAAIYIIVFLMWILWFERFSERKLFFSKSRKE
ncbi:MAG: hypothetical protein ACOYXB_09750 [Bacteroidota bacterium]